MFKSQFCLFVSLLMDKFWHCLHRRYRVLYIQPKLLNVWRKRQMVQKFPGKDSWKLLNFQNANHWTENSRNFGRKVEWKENCYQKHFSNFPSTWLANWRYSFWTGQSWHVLKSWYTAGGPEQGFLRCFADRHNRSLVLSVAQASSGKAFEFVTFFGELCVIACPSQQHYEHLNSGITISFIYIFLEYRDYSRLSINKLNWKSLLMD